MRVNVTMVSCLLLVAVIGAAQMNSAPAKPAVTVRSGQMGAVALRSVKGQPYSVEQITERNWTLADGTHISQTITKIRRYRDSQGRIRIEGFLVQPAGVRQDSMPEFVFITDPVAGYQYTLDSARHIAARSDLRALRSAWVQHNPVPQPPFPPKPDTQSESLGTQMIEGVLAQGTRSTTTFPTGAVGNDRPFTITAENWIAPGIGLAVLSKHSDPRYSGTTTRLNEISQSEPDPNLFLVPPDYTIVDQQLTPAQ